jgi:CRISPR type III-B/RAMP module RAMP protein Cmr4
VFEKAAMLFLYCETPVHAGTGTSLSIVDLPIQRERITGLPIVQASSLKGVLRAEVERLKGKQIAEALLVQKRNAPTSMQVASARTMLVCFCFPSAPLLASLRGQLAHLCWNGSSGR